MYLMNIDATNIRVYVYTVAVIFSGVFIADSLSDFGSVVVFSVSGIIAAFWSIYFRSRIVPYLNPVEG